MTAPFVITLLPLCSRDEAGGVLECAGGEKQIGILSPFPSDAVEVSLVSSTSTMNGVFSFASHGDPASQFRVA
jgi:hypothetical protein